MRGQVESGEIPQQIPVDDWVVVHKFMPNQTSIALTVENGFKLFAKYKWT